MSYSITNVRMQYAMKDLLVVKEAQPKQAAGNHVTDNTLCQ